jgi:hypothetical protein
MAAPRARALRHMCFRHIHTQNEALRALLPISVKLPPSKIYDILRKSVKDPRLGEIREQ